MSNLKRLSSHPHKHIYAEGDNRFWVHDGPVLGDIGDLNRALKEMSDEQYSYHVNGEKNDFANWVGQVLQDPHCAEDLQHAKSRHAAQHVVENHLAHILNYA